jgi:CBS domain-containing protein
VVDEAGRPVGVLSQTDIVIHDRNHVDYVPTVAEYYDRADLAARLGDTGTNGFLVENVDRTLVRDIMTPTVIAVSPTDSVIRVVGEMVAFKVHRLFVMDNDGVLVGVISAYDVLRRLRSEP